MKILCTSDTHLGKRVHEFSMLEDQRHILGQIVDIASKERPDAVIIAGDVYDRSVPPEDAVTVFGDFLTSISDLGCEVFVIAGNHDSGIRLDYCNTILGRNGIHIAGKFEGSAERHVMTDDHGEVDVWMLPFFRVSEARSFSGEDLTDYGSAMRWVLEESGVDQSRRNLLVAHQFFAGSTPLDISDSEDQKPEVGGISNIPVDTLDPFDFVALGHIHKPQHLERPTIRYCGSPLKYSKSEARMDKSVILVEMRDKGDVDVRTIPLVPLRDMRIIRGRAEDLVADAPQDGRDDYIHVELTANPSQGLDELRRTYPNIMSVEILTERSYNHNTPDLETVMTESTERLFARFYNQITGEELSDYQRRILSECLGVSGRDVE